MSDRERPSSELTELVANEDLADEIDRIGVGRGSTLVLAEADDGCAGAILAMIPDRLQPVRRAIAARAGRAKVGGVADTLDLDDVTGGSVVVENAQWADPTSIGRLQRLLSHDDGDLLVVVAHAPVAPEEVWWLGQLAETGREHGSLVRTRLTRDASPIEVPDDGERDLVLAAGMLSQPLSVSVAARLLGSSEPEALTIAERLVARGLLTEARSGFLATTEGRTIQVGEARRGHLAGRLAPVLEEGGEDPGVVGSLLLASGDAAAAYPRLRNAALAAQSRSAGGEAYHLAESALSAAEEASVGEPGEIGGLHLICGRHLRSAGRSEAANHHLDAAIPLLEDIERIDALVFAAAVADDRQHPQDAERILAVAEWEAAHQGESASLGSIGTFRARALNRIGFAAESDRMLEKATAILAEHASPAHLSLARQNRAWILFDRGHVAKAEVEFTHLRDHTESNNLAELADKEAWRARTLFPTGRPREAIEAVHLTRDLANQAEVEAPLFLADLALTEGNLLFKRPAEALEAANRVWDLVERQLPAWRNIVHANRAQAFLDLGDAEQAESEIQAALEVIPPGSNGWRWRNRCRAIAFEVAAARGTFPLREAEDLVDLFLQSGFHGWAADLSCVIAEQTGHAEVAGEAMALAVNIGNPMLAARAAHAGGLWDEPGAAAAIRGIRATALRLPEGWEEDWKSIPYVAAALAAPEPSEDDTGAENIEVLERALRRAGLESADTVLSPAQRRSRGLVRHRRRRLSPLRLVAAALGVVVLAGATSFAVAQVVNPDEPAAEESEVTTIPEPLSLEETQIEVPVDLLFGTSSDRGGNGRSGFVDVAGPRSVDGYYWVHSAADAISATPLAYGNNLMVGSADGTFQAIDLTRGRAVWSVSTEDQIDASGAISTGETASGSGAAPVVGEGGADAGAGTVVIVGDDGVVRARDALLVTATQMWTTALDSTIKSSPVIDNGVVFVATTSGLIHALDMSNGDVLWRYPSEGSEPLGRITADLTLSNGIIYVGTEDGGLHLIGTDGALLCESILDAPIVVNPVVVDGRAYVSYGQVIRVIPEGVCPDQVPITEVVQFLSETVVDVAPAVVGDLIYVANADFLNAVDRAAVEQGVGSPEEAHHWSVGKVNADGKIASPPVVTQDAVYFGTETGKVYAVDADTGDLLWEWQTGNYVRASPVVIEGAVYFASGDGNVYAVGPAG